MKTPLGGSGACRLSGGMVACVRGRQRLPVRRSPARCRCPWASACSERRRAAVAPAAYHHALASVAVAAGNAADGVPAVIWAIGPKLGRAAGAVTSLSGSGV